jgi:hypothetical protein
LPQTHAGSEVRRLLASRRNTAIITLRVSGTRVHQLATHTAFCRASLTVVDFKPKSIKLSTVFKINFVGPNYTALISENSYHFLTSAVLNKS